MQSIHSKSFFLGIIFLATSFSMFAGEHKNNFRLEKRHYRKGFYFDCWLHPKTYSRNYTTPTTRLEQAPAEQKEKNQSQSNKSSDGKSLEIDIPSKRQLILPEGNQAPISAPQTILVPNN